MAINFGSLSPATLTEAAIIGILFLHVVRKLFFKPRSPLDTIPSVGALSHPFGFYVGMRNYIRNGRAVTEEGYIKYPGRAFKVALGNRWLVLFNGPTLIEDIRTAPTEYLSASAAVNSLLHLVHTMGSEQFHDPYQILVIKGQMTCNIGVCFPDIRNEAMAAFKDLVPAELTNGSRSQPCRYAVPSEFFASTHTCEYKSDDTSPSFEGFESVFYWSKILKGRDPEYIKITTDFALNVARDAIWLHATPSILRPIAARLFGHLEPATRNATKLLGPTPEYRLQMDDEYGPEWPNGDRPNDMIIWLLDEARGHPKRRTVRQLTRQVLNVNFAALHTTTQGFIHALYNLAANLQYLEPLREEIESVVESEGWTKAAMGKMVKLDSFCKESSRLRPLVAAGVVRQVLKDFTFSNGSTVPVGTLVGIPVLAEHQDEANYAGGCEFDPFRFSRMREQEGQGTKHQMISLGADFLTFGIGLHACPGRFFAADVQKLLLAHVIFTYDLKFQDGMRPEDEWMALMSSPNRTAEIMFRRRN